MNPTVFEYRCANCGARMDPLKGCPSCGSRSSHMVPRAEPIDWAKQLPGTVDVKLPEKAEEDFAQVMWLQYKCLVCGLRAVPGVTRCSVCGGRKWVGPSDDPEKVTIIEYVPADQVLRPAPTAAHFSEYAAVKGTGFWKVETAPEYLALQRKRLLEARRRLREKMRYMVSVVKIGESAQSVWSDYPVVSVFQDRWDRSYRRIGRAYDKIEALLKKVG